jgi:Xaa-Pro aminopeptidase
LQRRNDLSTRLKIRPKSAGRRIGQLGIIKSKDDVGRYYPHGCSHFIGLDVHDKGIYQTMMANMAITVEPVSIFPSTALVIKNGGALPYALKMIY